MKFKFELTLDEANLLVEALSELPFKRSALMIQKLNQQADAQVQAAQQKESKGEDVKGEPEQPVGGDA